jgi:hypothetical protein
MAQAGGSNESAHSPRHPMSGQVAGTATYIGTLPFGPLIDNPLVRLDREWSKMSLFHPTRIKTVNQDQP